MGYAIYIVDGDGKTVYLDRPHQLRGGTYAVGGTCEAYLSVTYNYRYYFKGVFGEKGIGVLKGMDVKESIPILEKAVAELAPDSETNYWAPTEGNARRAIENLLELARLAPGGKWKCDS